VSDVPISPRSADRLTRAARAAQALSETLWEELHEELSDPSAARVAALSERLAEVSATVGLLARADAGSPAASAAPVSPPPPPVKPRAPVGRVIHEEPSARSEPPTTAQEPPTARESPSAAVLVDELASPEPPEIAPPGSPVVALREPEIEIRDERGEHAPSEWIASIGRLLERYARDGAPFAVLLVELADVERLRHAELPGEVSRLTGMVEAALSAVLRPVDSLTRESPGRYWLLAPETDSGGSRELVERLASAVRNAASHRGAPLEVAVGIAVCPRDGSQAAALAAQAEIALYAARASGKPIA
jgi:GGDEF domain-containing protein